MRFEEQPDPAVYEQVLATYLAIRDALAGFDPATNRATQTRNDVTYNRRFRDINVEYQPGDASYTQLDSVINDVIPGRGADRLVRQAGFSKSDSLSHIDALYDLGHGYTTQSAVYGNRPTTPLLWTQDNDLPLDGGSYVQTPGTTDEDRAFFRDQQTIFGGLDDPFNQYIGPSFLRGFTQHHNDDFFETSVAAGSEKDSIGRGTRFVRTPAGDPVIQTAGGGNGAPATLLEEDIDFPETGKPIEKDTMAKWQMIISSFAEHNSDLDSRSLDNPLIKNVAAIGLLNIVGGAGAASPELRASDASSYADFAAKAGVGDFDRVEPIGKRGSAGFNPVVPVN